MIEVKNIRLDTASLERYAKELDGNIDTALRAIAKQVEGYAKVLCPKDTHALMNSIISEPMPGKRNTHWIHDGVEYGIYQELGTHKMSAHPFMIPATEKAAADVERIYKKALA